MGYLRVSSGSRFGDRLTGGIRDRIGCSLRDWLGGSSGSRLRVSLWSSLGDRLRSNKRNRLESGLELGQRLALRVS